MDVLLGSRAETSQATSCHLPLPAQPRQTGPAGVRKSPVQWTSSHQQENCTGSTSVSIINITIYKVISSSLFCSSLFIFFFQDRQKHLKCLEDVLKPLFG